MFDKLMLSRITTGSMQTQGATIKTPCSASVHVVDMTHVLSANSIAV
jgi:hypothetical protein